MTMQLTFSCDGTAPSGASCRGALPTGTNNEWKAISAARGAGWRIEWDGDTCPSCTTRAKEASS